MNQIIKQGRKEHQCSPGWDERDGFMIQRGLFAAPGTVVRCVCGTTYVAFYDPSPRFGMVTESARWRKENLAERWLRRRQERRE